ncbi:hypothetical protein CASFOL_023088 [Castilleja foliolosa]|uniref:Ubiquitin thioesterase OTU n=1 Tax=Castilleja foliolosa TaxID=1961234 RepID=A0ABD3CKN8_9LAMI
MLRVLCARPRPPPCFQSFLSFSLSAAAPFHRLLRDPTPPPRTDAGNFSLFHSPAAASVWHTILPSYRRPAVLSHHERGAVRQQGEGSWNVAWDARPARWLHYPDSAWLLFGVCVAASAQPLIDSDPDSNLDRSGTDPSCNYRVKEVTADGRCLFRAIAHMACLRNGEEAPDENREKELADELRAQAVEELLKRRKEVEWCMEEEFDKYVKTIQQPCAWGGEPELIMCSHVLRDQFQSISKKEARQV